MNPLAMFAAQFAPSLLGKLFGWGKPQIPEDLLKLYTDMSWVDPLRAEMMKSVRERGERWFEAELPNIYQQAAERGAWRGGSTTRQQRKLGEQVGSWEQEQLANINAQILQQAFQQRMALAPVLQQAYGEAGAFPAQMGSALTQSMMFNTMLKTMAGDKWQSMGFWDTLKALLGW